MIAKVTQLITQLSGLSKLIKYMNVRYPDLIFVKSRYAEFSEINIMVAEMNLFKKRQYQFNFSNPKQ